MVNFWNLLCETALSTFRESTYVLFPASSLQDIGVSRSFSKSSTNIGNSQPQFRSMLGLRGRLLTMQGRTMRSARSGFNTHGHEELATEFSGSWSWSQQHLIQELRSCASLLCAILGSVPSLTLPFRCGCLFRNSRPWGMGSATFATTRGKTMLVKERGLSFLEGLLCFSFYFSLACVEGVVMRDYTNLQNCTLDPTLSPDFHNMG